jgi:hypothetical protein
VLAFEELLDDPDRRLVELATFIDVDPTPAWLEFARNTLDPARRGASLRRPTAGRLALEASCKSGTRALG